MPLNLPTTEELKQQSLSILESNLGQEAPLQEKSVLNVISVLLALTGTIGLKFGAERALQNFALTASKDTLINVFGVEYNLPIKAAEAFQCTATLPATTGTTITTNIDYLGDSNGVRYNLDSQVVAAAGVATLQLTAQELGTTGNLLVGDTLSISSQIPGAETVATVTVITNTGANEESTESYRQRVLSEIRGTKGGGNSSDVRSDAEEVAGVESAYPYAMRPDQVGGGNPGERTVYIEAETTIDPDGIPTSGLLAEAKSSIILDPVTGKSRNTLGIVSSTLYVLPISRTGFFVIITGLNVSVDQEAQVKTDIETALTEYFVSLSPYVEGLDPVESKNNEITAPTISSVIQDIVDPAGGSFTNAQFNVGASTLPSYELNLGEHGKLAATPTYA